MAGAATTAEIITGLVFLAVGLGLGSGTSWFAWTHGPGMFDGARERTDPLVRVGANGVRFGSGPTVLWAAVRALVVDDAWAGGDDSGEPVFVPTLGVVLADGSSLSAVRLEDYHRLPELLRPVVERWATHVPVTDRRRGAG